MLCVFSFSSPPPCNVDISMRMVFFLFYYRIWNPNPSIICWRRRNVNWIASEKIMGFQFLAYCLNAAETGVEGWEILEFHCHYLWSACIFIGTVKAELIMRSMVVWGVRSCKWELFRSWLLVFIFKVQLTIRCETKEDILFELFGYSSRLF